MVKMVDHSLHSIGLVGLINISVLTFITIVQAERFIATSSTAERFKLWSWWKKFAFHLLLISASAADLPMYIAFLSYNRYTLISYSFHKLSSACFFTAFSITISDWSVLLHELKEYKSKNFLFRTATLIFINVIYILTALTNFVYCYTVDSIDDYSSSGLYIPTYFFQIGISFVLSCLMLSAGLKVN